MWGEVQLGGLVGTSQAENWPLLKLNNEYIGVGVGGGHCTTSVRV